MRQQRDLDEALMQNADLSRENERLRDALARCEQINATCEALGL